MPRPAEYDTSRIARDPRRGLYEKVRARGHLGSSAGRTSISGRCSILNPLTVIKDCKMAFWEPKNWADDALKMQKVLVKKRHIILL